MGIMTSDIVYIVLTVAILVVSLVGIVCGLAPLRRTGNLCKKNARKETCISESENESTTAEGESVSDMRRKDSFAPDDINPADLPPLSVIVYALCDEERLTAYIEQLMCQIYPDFEVVVVFDGTQEAASEIADVLMTRYPSLRMTFVPPGSHNLSRRKLAWTLGIKGAENDVVLTTGANTHIPSEFWLCRMAAPFSNPEVDLVLGDTRFDFQELTGAGRWYHQFERVMINSSWISSALKGKAFRGDCYNMAFRRELFFSHNGYAASTGKPFGDDDVFVCQISDEGNTRVVLTDETLLTMDWGVFTSRIRTTLKEQQMFSSRELPKGPFLRQGLLSCCNWLVFLLSAASIVFSLLEMLPSVPWPAVAASVILLSYWGVQIGVYRRAATTLQAVRLWWSVPLFMLWHPIANAVFRFRHRNAGVMDFIWNGYQ